MKKLAAILTPTLFGLVLFFDSVQNVDAGSLVLDYFLRSPDGSKTFGWTVAGSPNHAAIGTGGPTSESVYVYNLPSGTLNRIITNPTGETDDDFGFSVAISGNLIVVGARADDRGAMNTGAAHVFEISTGNLVNTFLNPNPVPGDTFGSTVAISGNKIIIGGGTTQAAYIFDVSDPSTPLHTLSDPAVLTFGQTVAAVGNNFLVRGLDSVLLIDSITGGVKQTFFAPTLGQGFGQSFAALNQNVLVGAPADDTAEVDAGAVFLFDVSTGGLLQTFVSPNATDGDMFGHSISAVGSDVLVGAFADKISGPNNGAAYLFNSASGALIQTILNPDPSTAANGNDWFGWAVAGAGTIALIGTPRDDIPGVGGGDVGTVYVFTPDPDTDGDGILDSEDACINSDLRPTVFIGGLNSGVQNRLLTTPKGCTLADIINELVIIALVDASNGGDFQSSFDSGIKILKSDGTISGSESGALKSTAAKAPLP